ncbi:response regulator [Paenibacillus sp. CF384]|uniref:response regulator transcription factor n=1 Tax=Paenibacillus sp. CF384 TaxID=1884382 RepID=UPI00089BFB6F|nr:response regulator [Paenibacillus sp. CF384]SDW47724.1 Two-component response regulator, YesN/AraC family, consists of REC and AraC-type DNA-binding domains [Paenibacillus sp. CF384]
MILQPLVEKKFNHDRAISSPPYESSVLIETDGDRSQGLKALIIDDERHVRQAVQLLVEWERHGIRDVFEATDGESAILMIREHHPEVIITDMMMPGVDGTELLSWIQEHAPCSKTIVISGYNDFRLVRHSMKTGGLDYLLKPINESEIQTAVKRAVLLWKQEADSRKLQCSINIEVNQLKPICWEKLFTQLIQHPDDNHKQISEIKREFSSFGDMASCRCSILSLTTIDERIQHEFGKHHDLLFFALTNVCNEILRKSMSGFAFRYWSSEDEIVLLHWNKLDHAEKIIEEINHSLFKSLGARFDFGIGTEKKFHHEVQQAYLEAKAALHQRNVQKANDRIYVLESAQDSNVMTDIQKYIQTHYFNELSLMHLSNTFHFSREHISRRFKQDFGVNVSDYLEQIRIAKAKQFLSSPCLKISQIAEMVGYPDMKYFTKVFKKTTGNSPQHYRNALKS